MLYDVFFQYGYIEAGRLKKRQEARLRNNIAFQTVLAQLIEDYFASFEIDGLDATMSSRAIKEALLFRAQMTIFEKEGIRFALGGAGGMSGINANGDFSKSSVSAPNGFFEEVSLYIPGAIDASFLKKTADGVAEKPRGVLIRENELLFPFIYTVFSFAEAIADTYRAMDVVRANLKKPLAFIAAKEDAESVRATLDDRDENVEAIVVTPKSRTADPSNIRAFPVAASSEDIRQLSQTLEWYFAQYYQRLGIDTNASPDKAAQISVAEVKSNSPVAILQGQKRIDCINRYLDQANAVWGTHYHARLTGAAAEKLTAVKEVESDETDNNL